MVIKHNAEQHADFNLDTIDLRFESTQDYIKYLKHLQACQLANGEMNTYNVLQMVVNDLEKVIDLKRSK